MQLVFFHYKLNCFLFHKLLLLHCETFLRNSIILLQDSFVGKSIQFHSFKWNKNIFFLSAGRLSSILKDSFSIDNKPIDQIFYSQQRTRNHVHYLFQIETIFQKMFEQCELIIMYYAIINLTILL